MAEYAFSSLILLWSSDGEHDYIPDVLLGTIKPIAANYSHFGWRVSEHIERLIKVARIHAARGEAGPYIFALCEQEPDQSIDGAARATIEAAFSTVSSDPLEFRLADTGGYTHLRVAERTRREQDDDISDIAIIVVTRKSKPFSVPLFDSIPPEMQPSRE